MKLEYFLNSADYHLSGSRWWGYHRFDSDWDFISQYSESRLQFLLSAGFIVGFNGLSDPADGVLCLKLNDIEIALCLNSRAKLKVRDILTPLPMGLLSKSQRKWLWVTLYKLYS